MLRRTRRRRVKLFERAAKGGNARANVDLAALDGGVASTNPADARALYGKAAEGNSAEAEYQLGLLQAQGLGGAKDDAAARINFEKAAAQGHIDAAVWAGAFWEIGRGGAEGRREGEILVRKGRGRRQRAGQGGDPPHRLPARA